MRLVDTYPKPPAGAVETDFVRSGPFPFMRLPMELRFQIYGLVLAPLLTTRGAVIPDNKPHLHLRISEFEDGYYGYHLLSHVRNLLTYGLRKNPELERVYREEEKEVATLCQRFCYPSTARGYEITHPRDFTHRAPDGKGRQRERIPPAMFASIRNLSNVSCQIRQEFGIFAWTRSMLEIGFFDHAAGLVGLKDRPAIHKGLKGLTIGIQWNNDGLKGSSMAFISLIEFLDKNLQLETLLVRLRVPWYQARKFLADPDAEKPKWLLALQGLKCVRHFGILPHYFSRWSDMTGITEDLTKEVTDKLENLLRPSGSLIMDHGSEEVDEEPSEDWQGKLSGDSEFDEEDEPGFHYRIQDDGSFRDTPSTYFEKHAFQFEKHPWYESPKAYVPPESPDSASPAHSNDSS